MKTAQILLHISMLVASGAFDAHSTNTLAHRCDVAGTHFLEVNPLMRPFAGHKTAYFAIPVGDLAVYGLLLAHHKPHAARDWAFAESGAHIALGMNNLRQHPIPFFSVGNPSSAAAQAAANSATSVTITIPGPPPITGGR